MGLSRRDLLRLAPAAAVGISLNGRRGLAQDESPPAGDLRFPGMIVRMQEPRNLETPPDGLVAWKTKTEHFYVRSHFAVPKLDAAGYTLKVTGHVAHPLTLSLEELLTLPAVTKPLLLECAGNGRVFLTPPARGLQWGHGAVGNAEWTGVALGAVLERAKVKAGAVDVVLVGKDTGTIADPATPGPIAFDRSVPLAKAKRDECLLATAMNGEPLTPAHGAPVRAVIGGWYGMASVKWLVEIRVTDRPYSGFFQTLDYSYWVRKPNERPELVPVTAMHPKAIIVHPGLNDAVPAGKEFSVSGKAWAGEKKVAKVEFSADDGKTWAAAKLAGQGNDFSWRGWSIAWTPAAAGPARLVARCTDEAGNTQPDKRDPDRRSYMIDHLVPIDVMVK
jgi:DMSO/TMAO reductase YedYZ molybdopterin-dependent catalytic subunit